MELINMAITLYAGLLFIRGLVDWVGPFRANVVVEAIHRATDPVIMPFHMVFPKKSPFPGIIAMVVLLLLKWVIFYNIGFYGVYLPIVRPFIDIWQLVFRILFWWMLGYAILSWIGSPPHPAVEVLNKVANALLWPIRRIVPSFGGLDLSPIVLIVGIQIIGQLVIALIG